MESQPQNPAFRNNPESFTHAYNVKDMKLSYMNICKETFVHEPSEIESTA